jgi:hypothetical protein
MSTSSEENFSFAGQTAEQQADTDVESKDSQETAAQGCEGI